MKYYKDLSDNEKRFASGVKDHIDCACIIHEETSAMKATCAYICDMCDNNMIRSCRPLWRKIYDWVFNY